MKKTKIISSLISASLVMSIVGGCSLLDSDNKAVLEAAENYAEAFKKCDLGDIADLTDDGDDLEDEIDEYINSNLSNDEKEEIAELILDSMNYEIDSKSVESSKKSKKASVEITFTIVDYQSVYEDNQDDGGDAEDFISDLEDCDDVIEIEVKLDLILDDGDWLVKDKKFGNVYDIYEFYEDVGNMSWVNFTAGEVTGDLFEEACEAVFAEDADFVQFTEYTIYFCETSSYDILSYYYSYTSHGDAEDLFADAYSEFVEYIEDGSFDGFAEYEIGDDSGYILFDGYSSDSDFFYGDCYGGVFWTNDTLLYSVAMSGDDDDESLVRDFLNYLGYPAP